VRKWIAGILSVVLALSSVASVARAYSLEQTYRVLQITAEDFINELKGAGVSEEMISDFLTDLSNRIAQQETLTEENFNSVMASVMAGLLYSGNYNNLQIAMISLYSQQVQVMLVTKTIPEEFQPLYDTVKACLLETGDLQIFLDVPKDHWAEQSIEALTVDGIVNGMGNRLFAPDDMVTREQFVKMAVDSLGLQGTADGLPFEDVQTGAWYVPYVTAAYQNQMISGISAEQFGVGQPMKRQDMAVIIYRIMKQKGCLPSKSVSRFDSFEDAEEIDDYAKEAVQVLCDGGMISGMSAAQYAPQAFVTRAQAARMIDLMCQSID